jgi:transposase
MLAQVLDGMAIEQPEPVGLPNLCADNGYRGAGSEQTIMEHDYCPHIRGRGEEKSEKKEGYRARRWVVEACHSWHNRFRKLLVRFEKQVGNYIALLQFACALICWRKVI